MAGPSRRNLVLGAVGVVLAITFGILFVPIMRAPYRHEVPQPPPDYAAAVAEIRRQIAATPPEVNPEARTILLDHGHPTEKVFVLLHGLSNCPPQFLRLGQELHARGHTVLIPRLPYHGEKDLMTESWARLSERDMLDTANSAVDLARGLGTKVTAAGLSVNGTVCAWIAQNRSDLHHSVLMAPFFAPAGFPTWAARPVERLLLRLPNFFLWWDPVQKQNLPRPPLAYPRFPTRLIGETMRLGSEVTSAARHEPPACANILVITSAADAAVSNAFTKRLVTLWQDRRPEAVTTYEFPKEDEVPHDFIDPAQPNQRVEIVYPRLLRLLEK